MGQEIRVRRVRTRRSVHSKNQRCPAARYRTVWCYGGCHPVEGMGLCGRVAPHAIRGRTQQAIDAAQANEETRCEFDPTELENPELWCKHGSW